MQLSSKPQHLLSDVRVLEWVPENEAELTHLAVAFAGRLLADLGAEVFRFAPEADPLTRLKSSPAESAGSVLATFLNRSKRVIPNIEALDSRLPLNLLLSGSDEVPPQWQDTLPVVSTRAAGVNSGLEDVPVSELGIQGLVGLTDLFGEPDSQPLMMGGHQTAYATGYAVFCAAMASLTKHRLLGGADVARVNAVDALAWVNWKGVAAGTLGFPVVRGGRGAEAPVLRCANGYFAFLHLPNNWADIVAEVNDARLGEERFASAGKRAKHALALNEILAEWAAERTWESLFEFCQRCAIPGGPVLRGAELLDDPLYLHRDYFTSAPHVMGEETREIQVPGLPLTVEDQASVASASAESPPRFSDNTPSDLPLSGKLVVDLGIFTAGSVTSTLLADLGACVIKVESESYSDPFRKWPGIKGDSPLFTFNNRNKLGVNLDLKSAAGRATFLELVAQADVVVENFRRGVLQRLGIDYPVLREANPKVVLASISGQGASGPGSGHVSFGSTLEAIGGVAALTGYPNEGCYISGRNLNYPDQIVCLYGAGAVMAALLNVQKTGRGMHLDVSQREVTTLAVGETIAAASLFDETRGFTGNRDRNQALQDIYRVRDGWLCVTASSQAQADDLAQLLGCAASDVETALGDWLSTKTAGQAIEQLRRIRLAVFKANTGGEAADEPAVRAGTAFASTAAGLMVKGFPFQFDESRLRVYEESPAMGEHTEHVLSLLTSSAS